MELNEPARYYIVGLLHGTEWQYETGSYASGEQICVDCGNLRRTYKGHNPNCPRAKLLDSFGFDVEWGTAERMNMPWVKRSENAQAVLDTQRSKQDRVHKEMEDLLNTLPVEIRKAMLAGSYPQFTKRLRELHEKILQ